MYSESNTREIWAYRIEGTKLASPRKVITFSEAELDGLRTGTDGNILVARNGQGTVAMVTPDGTLLRENSRAGKEPNEPDLRRRRRANGVCHAR